MKAIKGRFIAIVNVCYIALVKYYMGMISKMLFKNPAYKPVIAYLAKKLLPQVDKNLRQFLTEFQTNNGKAGIQKSAYVNLHMTKYAK